MRKFTGIAFAVLATTILGSPVSAAGITTDASFYSSYVWRGVTIVNRPVLQPDAFFTVDAAGVDVSLGGWLNVEPAKYDGPRDMSLGDGSARFSVTEVDFWLEGERSFRHAGVTAGAIAYRFPNVAGASSAFNSAEVYAKVRVPHVPGAPSLGWYQDVSRVRGSYVELSLSQALPLRPDVSLTLGAATGYSMGQELDPTGDDGANFAEKGFTHADLSASAGFPVGAIRLAPTVHAILGRDAFTKFTAPDETADAKFWFGLTATWAGQLGAAKAE